MVDGEVYAIDTIQQGRLQAIGGYLQHRLLLFWVLPHSACSTSTFDFLCRSPHFDSFTDTYPRFRLHLCHTRLEPTKTGGRQLYTLPLHNLASDRKSELPSQPVCTDRVGSVTTMATVTYFAFCRDENIPGGTTTAWVEPGLPSTIPALVFRLSIPQTFKRLQQFYSSKTNWSLKHC